MKWSSILYLVTNESVETPMYYQKIESALKGGVDILQIREKTMESGNFYKRAKNLRDLTKKYNKTFIVNDRLDIALAVEADGLHIGQKDLPIELCRKYLNNKMIGVSVSNISQAKEASQKGADYLGLGAIYPTGSKADYTLLSEEIAEIAKTVNVPIIGIGGIKLNHVESLMNKGLAGIAVISAILGKEDPYKEAKKFKNILK